MRCEPVICGYRRTFDRAVHSKVENNARPLAGEAAFWHKAAAGDSVMSPGATGGVAGVM